MNQIEKKGKTKKLTREIRREGKREMKFWFVFVRAKEELMYDPKKLDFIILYIYTVFK